MVQTTAENIHKTHADLADTKKEKQVGPLRLCLMYISVCVFFFTAGQINVLKLFK